MKKFLVFLMVLAITVLLGFLIYSVSAKKENSNSTKSSEPKTKFSISGDIIMADSVATIYYGDGCSHCANVEEWLREKGFLPKDANIKQSTVDGWIENAKIRFSMKEVWKNKKNSEELSQIAKKLGIAEDQVGVPFLYDSVNNKSYIGETEIEDFFEKSVN